MRTLWFEFSLTLRRLFRRPAQNGLLLATFSISVTLSVLTWSLFRTVHLSNPDFDPKGEYLVLHHTGQMAVSARQMTVDELAAYQAADGMFDDFSPLAFYLSTFIPTPQGEERVLGAYLSARMLQLTGAKPLVGSLFLPGDDVYRAPGKVLLSEKLWDKGYGRDPHIVGKVIEISGYPSTIIGVMPAGFRFPNDQDIWMSLGSCYDHPDYPVRSALVKLKHGVSREKAINAFQAIRSTLPEDSPSRKRGEVPTLSTFRDHYLLSDLRISALILFALSLLFVAVSCVNAANLMIIDFLGRRPEIASNLALGIPRSAAIRTLFWHVGFIALSGGAIALAVLPVGGPWLFDRIQAIMAPYWLSYHFAWQDVGVTLLMVAIAGLVTLVTPTVYLLLLDTERVIREHGGANRGTSRTLWRRVLLTGQIALLTVLGICAGLLVRSKSNVGASHWGFEAGRVFEAKISALSMDYPKGTKEVSRLAAHRRVLNEIRQRPGAQYAAFVDNPSGYSNGPYCRYATDPAHFVEGTPAGEAFYSRVTEQYFDTLSVPFVLGRDFPEDMPREGLHIAILTESLARKLWPSGDIVHRTFYVRFPWMKESDPTKQVTVHAVVRDFQPNGPRAKTNDAIFFPYAAADGAGSAVTVYVRDRSGMPTFQAINDAVHRGEPREALYFPSTIKRQIDLMLNSVRMTTDLTTVFAIAAVLLCAIGVYSLTVTQVLQSSREFGIRMALGAEPRALWQTFTKGHLLTAFAGVVIGIIGASQLIRVLESLLFGVNARDPLTYAAVGLAILLVAALACLPSLRRMKRIHPADCLRSL